MVTNRTYIVFVTLTAHISCNDNFDDVLTGNGIVEIFVYSGWPLKYIFHGSRSGDGKCGHCDCFSIVKSEQRKLVVFINSLLQFYTITKLSSISVTTI